MSARAITAAAAGSAVAQRSQFRAHAPNNAIRALPQQLHDGVVCIHVKRTPLDNKHTRCAAGWRAPRSGRSGARLMCYRLRLQTRARASGGSLLGWRSLHRARVGEQTERVCGGRRRRWERVTAQDTTGLACQLGLGTTVLGAGVRQAGRWRSVVAQPHCACDTHGGLRNLRPPGKSVAKASKVPSRNVTDCRAWQATGSFFLAFSPRDSKLPAC